MQRLIWPIAALLSTLLVSTSIHAQQSEWPSRPVNIVVPYTPGGGTDTVTRLLAERLSKLWGQPVVIENKPGGSSIIGTSNVVRSPPDGYRLLSTVPVTVQNVALRKNLPYDTVRDLVPVTEVNRQQYVVVARSNLKADTLSEALNEAKSAKVPFIFASSGVGSTAHIVAEKIKLDLGISFTHVPYRGSPELVRAVVGNEADLGLVDLQSALPYAKSGRLKILAVTGPKRVSILPDAPTLGESGVKGFEPYNWVGFFAPRGTPSQIIQKISDDINKVQSDPELVSRMINQLGVEPTHTTPDEFRKIFERDLETWSTVIKAVGITLD